VYSQFGNPASLNKAFIVTLSMPQAAASVPQPTNGSAAISSNP
jgi:hypothetical protein